MTTPENELVRRVDEVHVHVDGESVDDAPRGRRGPVRWALETALRFVYTLRADHTPTWAKTTVIGAAVYVVSWIDLVPDLLPVVGVVDDFFVVVAAVWTVLRHVTDDERTRARRTVDRWLGRA
ncbi:MAG: DUF1232 domain-containing protein [Phycisphaera sp.]|nr:DUF1232 domain-containing protein [Phycisphaera sp.]